MSKYWKKKKKKESTCSSSQKGLPAYSQKEAEFGLKGAVSERVQHQEMKRSLILEWATHWVK